MTNAERVRNYRLRHKERLREQRNSPEFKAKRKATYDANRDKILEAKRESYNSEASCLALIKRKYGLTPDEYETLIANGCNVCGTTDGKLCVDHDHKTGRVRGCLCNRCNLALGGYEIVLDNLDKFTEYLGGTL